MEALGDSTWDHPDDDLGVDNGIAQELFHDIYHDGLFEVCKWHSSKTVTDLLDRAMQRYFEVNRRRDGSRMKAIEAGIYHTKVIEFVEDLLRTQRARMLQKQDARG
jgi:hypothetical protein